MTVPVISPVARFNFRPFGSLPTSLRVSPALVSEPRSMVTAWPTLKGPAPSGSGSVTVTVAALESEIPATFEALTQ